MSAKQKNKFQSVDKINSHLKFQTIKTVKRIASFILLLLLAGTAFSATVVTYDYQNLADLNTLDKSSMFSLKADSTDIFVEDYLDYHVAHFSFSGTATMELTASQNITSYTIRPDSYGISATVVGKKLTFSITSGQVKPRYLIIQVNSLEKMVVLADELETDVPASTGPGIFNITKSPYNANKTWTSDVTSKIQDAIDDASSYGGGTVYVPAGAYFVTDPIDMKDDVNFYLEGGALIKSSTKHSDIPDVSGSSYGFKQSMIMLGSVDNVKMYGRGIVDASGFDIIDLVSGDFERRRKIIDGSSSKKKDITLEGFIAKDGTTWSVNLRVITRPLVKNLKVINWKDQPTYKIQNDGIDLCSSNNGEVDGCFIMTGDDVMCSKAQEDNIETYNLVFKNCVTYNYCAANKSGMQNRGSHHDILWKNNDAVACRRGIVCESTTGADTMYNIVFEDCRVDEFVRVSSSWTKRAIEFEAEDGNIQDITVTRCSLNGDALKTSSQLWENGKQIDGVHFTDLMMDGNLIMSLNAGNINNRGATDVTFSKTTTTYPLTVTSAHGTPTPAAGVTTHVSGKLINASVTTPIVNGTTQYVATGWTGTGSVGSGSGSSTSFNITESSTLTWLWQTNVVDLYTLTVTSAHGTPSPAGVTTNVDGTLIDASVTTPIVNGTNLYVATGWVGTGSVPGSGSGSSTNFNITANSTLTWLWETNAVVLGPVLGTFFIENKFHDPARLKNDGTTLPKIVATSDSSAGTIWTITETTAGSGLYYIDNGTDRLSDGNGGNDPVLVSTATFTDRVKWSIVESATADQYWLTSAAGNAQPRIRTDGTSVPDMESDASTGAWAQWELVSAGVTYYTLTYNAGANGIVNGTTIQTVEDGSDGEQVRPIPDANYHFVNWSDASTADPRTDTSVASDITVTANFAIDTHQVIFDLGANGTRNGGGALTQTVNHAASATAPTITPETNYVFDSWDKSFASVTSSMTVNAQYSLVPTGILWTPSNITTVAWYDASDANTITDVAGSVSQWDDKSGNANDVSQASGADQPVTTNRTIGGLNALDFDDQSLGITNSGIGLTGNPDLIIASILQYDASVGTSDRSISLGGGAGNAFQMAGGSHGYSIRYNDGNLKFASTITGNPILQVCKKNSGGTYNQVEMFINGTASAVTSAGSSDTLNLTDDVFWIGKGQLSSGPPTFTGPINGMIGEIVIVNASDTETRQKVEGYLAWKWGREASLPIGHPYKAYAPVLPPSATNAITASVVGNGTINPSGVIQVPEGNDQAFTITPDANHHIDYVDVDGTNKGAIANYTFTNVMETHAIEATFVIDTYQVIFDLGTNGTRSGGGALTQTVNHAASATVPTVTPDSGYALSGWDKSFASVTNNMTVNAQYSLAPIGSLWTPSNITTVAWYDAADASTITDSAGSVSQWDDKSGNANDVSQALGADQPVTTNRTIGGLNALDFNYQSLGITNSGIGLTGNPDIIIASILQYDVNVGSSDRAISLGGGGGNAFQMAGGSHGYSIRYNDGNLKFGSTITGTPILQVCRKNAGDAYNQVEMFINGTTSPVASATSPTNTLSLTDDVFWIGKGQNGGPSSFTGPINGKIGEIVIVNASDTETQQKVEGYLAWKWGREASLPIGHPYKTHAPVLSTNTHQVIFDPGTNGTYTGGGALTQTVNNAASATAPTITPDTGYTLSGWDKSFAIVTNNMTVNAQYSLNNYTLTYTSGGNGSIVGTATQTVAHGNSGTAVTPTPATDYHFVNWSDSSTADPRTDPGVTNDITVTANFAIDTNDLTAKGVPEYWLFRHGLTNGGYAAAELTDIDGDGMPAWKEYHAGTIPTDYFSSFKIILHPGSLPTESTNGFQFIPGTEAWSLVFLGGTNDNNIPFEIYRCTNLMENNWLYATNFLRTDGVNGTNTWVDLDASNYWPKLFYRIVAPTN